MEPRAVHRGPARPTPWIAIPAQAGMAAFLTTAALACIAERRPGLQMESPAGRFAAICARQAIALVSRLRLGYSS